LQCAIYGNFSGPKAQEVVVSRGKVLELLRPDESGKMQTILATEAFGAIRALMPFRLTSGTRDYIIIGSDSGRIVIVDYNKEKNAFIKVLTASRMPAASRMLAEPPHDSTCCNC
jgi:splicing factor 3B subunit 3